MNKEQFVNDLENLIEKYRETSVASTEMAADELNALIAKWSWTVGFLSSVLHKSPDTIYSYRHERLKIPKKVASKIRQLDILLTDF